MTPDEESCFRNLMERAEAMLVYGCTCSKRIERDKVDLCRHCQLKGALDACSVERRARRAGEHDKSMEQADVNAMELMDEDYQRLALSFPSIRNCPGLAETLKSAASPYGRTIAMLGCLHSWLWKGTKGKLEETERQACLFILSLWRSRDIWPEFDLYKALEVWDDQHRAAFQAWVTNFQRP